MVNSCYVRRNAFYLLSVTLFVLVKSVTPLDKVGSVECSRDVLTLRVEAAGVDAVQLDKWPSALGGCSFRRTLHHYELRLPLSDDLPCGTTRVLNTASHDALYYQRVRITPTNSSADAVYLVKCAPSLDEGVSHNLVRRDLPPEFVEPDFIEITSEVSGSAPIPLLGVGVRQDGSLVDGAINVAPGTPLTMEVFLDEGSAGTYGILVSYLEVTDNANKKETIVYNGCTIDPNLFENFDSHSGDLLSAKFRAFKFPESNYVLFRGTVDVCLDKCQGITCSDGKTGYGRRRRSVDHLGADPNKLFEVTMTTIIKLWDNVTSTVFPGMEKTEIFAEEVIERKASPFHRSEVPLIRRSPDSPPSVAFSAASVAGGPLLLQALIASYCLARAALS